MVLYTNVYSNYRNWTIQDRMFIDNETDTAPNTRYNDNLVSVSGAVIHLVSRKL